MEIISRQGDPELAEVFVARFRGNDRFLVEFVDARDPDVPAHEKWVVIVSTQFGCPVACAMCDAGGEYHGGLSAEEILSQVEHVVSRSSADRLASVLKFKVQFARMGEPALNPAVLDALRLLPGRFNAPGLIPCVATVAPSSAAPWFEELLSIRRNVYGGRPFQLQLSINSTDDAARDRLMPVPKMSLRELGAYAIRFSGHGPRKVSLNFAMARGMAIDPGVVARHFDPASACVKITPLNPTIRSAEQGLKSGLEACIPEDVDEIMREFGRLGFDVILSIGDARENSIGSNCGMAVRKIKGEVR